MLAENSTGSPDPLNDRQTNMDESNAENQKNNKAKLEPEENQRNGIVAASSKDIGGIIEKINELITRDDDTKNYKCNLCGKCAKRKEHI